MSANAVVMHNADGRGAPLVLVHGFTGSAADWAGVVDDLATDRPVVTYEHRGHGASENTGDPASYTFDRLTADFAAAVDEHGLDGFHLLGHSMGGIVAMRYALDHPDRLASLLLMDTAAKASPSGSAGFMQAGVDRVRASGELLPLLEGMRQFVDEESFARMEASWRQMDPVAFVALGTELLAYDDGTLERLATLPVRTTVLVGEHDGGLRGGADDLARTIPGAHLVVVPDAAHSPQLENRTAWLEAVHTHLGG